MMEWYAKIVILQWRWKMLKINSLVRIEELDGATEEHRKFINKDAIVLRKEEYDESSYILDINGEELLVNLEYDTFYDYETKQIV